MDKILIVDDEPEMVEMIKMRLEANDYKVITACNGKEGLEKAISEKPTLILLDIMMPDMDGFEVLRRLKNDKDAKHIPVVMLTAKGETESIFSAEKLGSSDYFIKPFESEELLDLVKRYA